MMREVTADDVRGAFGSLEPCAPISEGSKRNYALVQFDDGSIGVFRHDDEVTLPGGVVAFIDIGPWYPTSLTDHEVDVLVRALVYSASNWEHHARVLAERIQWSWRARAPFLLTAEWFHRFENEAHDIVAGETTVEKVLERAMRTWIPQGAVIDENRVYDWITAAVDEIVPDNEEAPHARS